ncbi:MAG: hypothetical protein EXR72_03540 [Myxococcales bacterium]|nr:hypothetical protein [Myxococcales bacterium]
MAARERSSKRVLSSGSRDRLQASIAALADTMPPYEAALAPTAAAREEVDFELPEGVARMDEGELLVLVANQQRIVGTRLRGPRRPGRGGARSRIPERFRGAALHLLVEKIEQSFAEATRDLGPPDADPRGELTTVETRALERGGWSLDPVAAERDPLARTAVAYAGLLADCLTVVEAAKLLGVEASRIRQRVGGTRPTLYALKLEGEWRIPRFQFAGRGALPGLEQVVPRLDRALHPVAVRSWLETPSPDLATDEGHRLSPKQWLCAGYPATTVAELAASLATH